jgi:hypothetical protein
VTATAQAVAVEQVQLAVLAQHPLAVLVAQE